MGGRRKHCGGQVLIILVAVGGVVESTLAGLDLATFNLNPPLIVSTSKPLKFCWPASHPCNYLEMELVVVVSWQAVREILCRFCIAALLVFSQFPWPSCSEWPAWALAPRSAGEPWGARQMSFKCWMFANDCVKGSKRQVVCPLAPVLLE